MSNKVFYFIQILLLSAVLMLLPGCTSSDETLTSLENTGDLTIASNEPATTLSEAPTAMPTTETTLEPTVKPTIEPTRQPEETAAPSPTPTATPTAEPTPTDAPTAEPTPQTLDYVLNTNTKKFHVPSCSSIETIKPEHRKNVNDTRENIISQGYNPCGKCHP